METTPKPPSDAERWARSATVMVSADELAKMRAKIDESEQRLQTCIARLELLLTDLKQYL